MEDDYMELGDTGWVPRGDGWFENRRTGERMDEEGKIYDKFGELIFDPYDTEEYDS